MTSLHWDHPNWLWAAAVLAGAGVLVCLVTAWRSRRPGWPGGLRLFLAAAAVAMLAAPELVRTAPAPRAVVFVVNAPGSGGVPVERLDAFIRRWVASRQGVPCSYGVILFGDQVVTAVPFPTSGASPAAIDWSLRDGLRGRSGAPAALANARLMLRDQQAGTVVLISDGGLGGVDDAAMRTEADRAAENGLDLEVVHLAGGDASAVSIHSVLFPRVVHRLALARIRVVVDNPGPAVEAHLVVSLDGRPDPLAGAAEVLRPGANVLERLVRADEAGQRVVRVDLETAAPPGGGAQQRYTRWDALTVINALKLLVVEGDAGASRELLRSLEGALQELPRAIESRDLAARIKADPALFQKLDVVALANVPESHLRGEVVARLGRFVRDGGGLVVYGGGRSFDCGGYADSELERELLPVASERKHPGNERAIGAFLLVIDASGSMSGPKLDLAKQVGRAAVEDLPDGMALTVIVFDAGAAYAAPPNVLTRANRGKFLAEIDALSASGGTDIAPALDKAREAVDESRTKIGLKRVAAHVLVISDGLAHGEEALKRQAAEFLKRDCKVHTVHIPEGGDGSGRDLLRAVAQAGGGRAEVYAEGKEVPRFRLTKDEIREDKARLGFVREPQDTVFQARTPPEVFGPRFFWDYNRAGLKPEARPSLSIDLGEPPGGAGRPPGYAWQHLGDDPGGLVMACLIDIEGIWSRGLLEGPHAKLLLSEPIFFSYRQKPEERLVGSLRAVPQAPGELVLTIRGQLPESAALEAREVSPAGARPPALAVPLWPTAPGEYQGRFHALAGRPYYRFRVVGDPDDPNPTALGEVLAVISERGTTGRARPGRPNAFEALTLATGRPILTLEATPATVPVRYATTRSHPWNVPFAAALLLLLLLGTLPRVDDGMGRGPWYRRTVLGLVLAIVTLIAVGAYHVVSGS